MPVFVLLLVASALSLSVSLSDWFVSGVVVGNAVDALSVSCVCGGGLGGVCLAFCGWGGQ